MAVETVTDQQFPDALAIADFYPRQRRPDDIYRLGSSPSRGLGGVPGEQAVAFDFTLDTPPNEANLAAFIGVMGPSKFSRENVPDVERRLGTGANVAQMARDWAVRLGMGRSMLRSFMSEEPPSMQEPIIVITGGVRNWMQLRAEEAIRLADDEVISRDARIILAAGEGRVVGQDPMTGKDLAPGFTQADYMRHCVRPYLESAFSRIELAPPVHSDKGRDVASAAVEAVMARTALSRAGLLVVATPSAWVETGGQIRRMARDQYPGFDADGRQLAVATYGIDIGGLAADPNDEPPLRYQSPWTAPGLAGWAYRELFLHTAPS